MVLGRFCAPAGGCPLTSARFDAGGGIFSGLGIGAVAPAYDAAESSLAGPDGFGFGFGGVFNDAAFAATGMDTSQIGDCVFEFDGIFDAEIPGEWAVRYVPPGDPAAAARITGGLYEIATVPLPLPASALGPGLGGLLLLAAGGVAARRPAAHLEGAAHSG